MKCDPVDAYISFNSSITDESVRQLLSIVLEKIPDDLSTIHLLLNSAGGSVSLALAAANFLESLSCDVKTYNLARVDSAALILFCAGRTRVLYPDAAFFAHAVSTELHGLFSVKALENEYLNLKKDFAKVTHYLSGRTGIPQDEWSVFMSETGHFFSAEEAVQCGLATEISRCRIRSKKYCFTIGDPLPCPPEKLK